MLTHPKLSQLAPSVIRPIGPFWFYRRLFLIVTLTLFLTHVTCDTPLDDDVSLTDHVVINACDINQTVVVSENLVQLKAMTGPVGKCNVSITPEGSTALSINLLELGINTTFSYSTFIETLASETQHCAGRYALLSSNRVPCSIVIKGSKFRFYFQNIDALIEVRAEHVEMTTCFENQSANMCNMTLYGTIVRQEEQSKEYRIREKLWIDGESDPIISFNVTSHLIKCDCTCPRFSKCTCTLGNREWQYSCITNSGKTSADLIIYEPSVTGVSFANTGLHHIKPDAFASVQTMKYLLLDHNNIEVLPMTMFEDLLLLEVLNLGYNNLTSISSGKFDSLDKLRYLDLGHNDIYTVPQDLFDFVYGKIFYLDMSSNQLTFLQNDTFTSQQKMDGTLDISSNTLSTLPFSLFTSLWQIYGTLDISNNNLLTLPSGVFSSLEVIDGALDISHNKLITLPDDMFQSQAFIGTFDLSPNSLVTLPSVMSQLKIDSLDLSSNSFTNEVLLTLHNILGSLDLSYNNLMMTLPNGSFTSSMKHLRILDLSHNQLVRLSDGVFDSLQNLLILNMSHNRLSTLSPDCFQTLHKLKLLNLQGNEMTTNMSLMLPLSALKVLDLSKNNLIQLHDDLFHVAENLESLDLSENSSEVIDMNAFQNLFALTVLNLSRNVLSYLPSFSSLIELKVLDLSNNLLHKFSSKTLQGLSNLQYLHLSNNNIVKLQNRVFSHLHKLLFVNISHNKIQAISSNAFNSQVDTIDLRGNNLYKISDIAFKNFINSSVVILVDKYSSCCFVEDAKCISQESRSEYLTCNRMLPSLYIVISMWVIAVFVIICNCAALYLCSQKRQANKVQKLLVLHLSVSDLLMGITMLILLSADMHYGDYFPSYAESWRDGFACKFAGFLAMLSSEGSVFFITLISIDRLLAIKYTLGRRRLTTKMAGNCVAIAWLAALVMSSLSIAASGEGSDIYSVSEVCIGIPMVRRHLTKSETNSFPIHSKTIFYTGTHERYQNFSTNWGAYVIDDVSITSQQIEQNVTFTINNIYGSQIAPINSIVIFLGINLLCFTVVAASYLIQIFLTTRKTSKQAVRTQTCDEEKRMAMKMFSLVFTDFCCWLPLCMACILAQANIIAISPVMYVWVVGFILPINSSINPFLYVLYGEISDYRQRKRDARNARQQIEMRRR